MLWAELQGQCVALEIVAGLKTFSLATLGFCFKAARGSHLAEELVAFEAATFEPAFTGMYYKVLLCSV